MLKEVTRYISERSGTEHPTREAAAADEVAMLLGWDGKSRDAAVVSIALKMVDERDEIHSLLSDIGLKPRPVPRAMPDQPEHA